MFSAKKLATHPAFRPRLCREIEGEDPTPISVPRRQFPLRGSAGSASSRGLLRAGVQLLLNKAGEILKPLKGRGGKLTWTGVDQAQRA